MHARSTLGYFPSRRTARFFTCVSRQGGDLPWRQARHDKMPCKRFSKPFMFQNPSCFQAADESLTPSGELWWVADNLTAVLWASVSNWGSNRSIVLWGPPAGSLRGREPCLHQLRAKKLMSNELESFFKERLPAFCTVSLLTPSSCQAEPSFEPV